MLHKSRWIRRSTILLAAIVVFLVLSFLLKPEPAGAGAVNSLQMPVVDLAGQGFQAVSASTFRLGPAEDVLAQGTVWEIGQHVYLPKGTLIYQGNGFNWPINACVPEDNWEVLVIGGPRPGDGYTWYDTSRKAVDQLPTSGTGWVAPDAPLVDCGTVPPPSSDTIPPVISNVNWRQDGAGRTVVKATVTDNVAVSAVSLWWNDQEYPMQLTGGDLYQAVVPQDPNGVVSHFRITAVDPSNNIGYWPDSGTQAERIRYLNWAQSKNTGSALEPVNTALGNFYSQHQDIYAPAPGLSFDFTRTYNSIATASDGPFGFGWTHNYNLHLQTVDDLLLHGVVVTYADGHTASFGESGGGFVSPPGDHDILTREGSGYVLTTPAQLKYHFDGSGKLVSLQDGNNHMVQLSYDGNHLTQIIDAAGRIYSLEYNGDHISKITDVLGRTYEYRYDGAGNLQTYKNPEGGLIQYTYNSEHWLLTLTDPNGHVFVTNTYDDRGRVIEQRDASHHLSTIAYPDERTAVITDNLNNVTRHIYDDHLRLIEDKDANGGSIFYQYDSDDNVILMKDRGGHETAYTYDDFGNVLTRQDALGHTAVFRYDERNNLTYQKDESGAETTLEYDSHNNLIHVHDAEGGDTFMTYDARGLIATLQDADSHTTRFSYDGQGNLQTMTDALSKVAAFEYDAVGRQTAMIDANGHKVHFEYDRNDRVTAIADPNDKATVFVYDAVGNLKSVTDRRGNTTLYEYNENDSLVQITDPRGSVARFTYDAMYHRLSYENWRGFVTKYEYDAVYNLSKVIDAKGAVTKFSYDADNNLTTITDAFDQKTRMEYDPLHRLTKVTDALDGITEYTYDALGRPSSILDPKGGTTQYGYDRLGRLLTLTDALSNVTRFAYDPVGNLLSVTNARGFTTSYEYDAVNRLLKQTSPLGYTLQMAYDGVGNVISLKDARGNITSFTYDANDNLIDVTDALLGHTRYTYDEESHRLTVTDPNGHTLVATYDELGNRTSLKLPMGETTTFSYDRNNNVIAMTNAKGKTTNFDYDELDLLVSETNPLGFATSYDYDALRRLVKLTDANGNSTQYGYDALDRLTSVTDALNGVTKYKYDPLGNLTAVIDANGHSTAFDVDLLGRVIGETNALGKSWTYGYDSVGNLVKRIDANGITTNYTFDNDNRLTKISYPSGPATTFAYDQNNNLIGMVDASGKSDFAYDRLNRLTQAGHTTGLLAGKKLTYGYDPAGNRTQIVYPDGKKVNYAYNANDWLTSTKDPAGTTTYAYDAVGLLLRQQNPNGTWTEKKYDDADRLIKLFNGKPPASTNLISSFEYTLDPVGNRIRTVETGTRGQAVTWTKDYTYDELYRLVESVETPSAKPYQTLTSTFTYDAVGNRLSMKTNITDKPNTPALPPAVTTLYKYNEANQLISFKTTGPGKGGAQETQFTYDNNGNRITMSGPTRAIDYSYDFENRLVGATTFDVLNKKKQLDAALSFTYDGLNHRIERRITEKGVRKTGDYLYDGLGYDLLAQYVNPGSPQTTYYYRDPLQVLSRQEIQGKGAGLNYFYHYDGLGSVSAWTNQAGKETQEYTYAPYGRLIDNNGPDNASNKTGPHNSLTFSGKLWDAETETYYFGARDYDPATGTWLQQDSYRGRLLEPMTLHRTMYVGDNPVNWIDLYGYDRGGEPRYYPIGTRASDWYFTPSKLGSWLDRTGCGYSMSCQSAPGINWLGTNVESGFKWLSFVNSIRKTLLNRPTYRLFMNNLIKYEHGVRGARRALRVVPTFGLDFVSLGLKEAETIAKYSVGSRKDAESWKMGATLVANVPINIISDFAGDIAGVFAGAGGVVCGPAAPACAATFYVATNVAVSTGVETGLDWLAEKSIDYAPVVIEEVMREDIPQESAQLRNSW